jgi:hypothetical protein
MSTRALGAICGVVLCPLLLRWTEEVVLGAAALQATMRRPHQRSGRSSLRRLPPRSHCTRSVPWPFMVCTVVPAYEY